MTDAHTLVYSVFKNLGRNWQIFFLNFWSPYFSFKLMLYCFDSIQSIAVYIFCIACLIHCACFQWHSCVCVSVLHKLCIKYVYRIAIYGMVCVQIQSLYWPMRFSTVVSGLRFNRIDAFRVLNTANGQKRYWWNGSTTTMKMNENLNWIAVLHFC